MRVNIWVINAEYEEVVFPWLDRQIRKSANVYPRLAPLDLDLT